MSSGPSPGDVEQFARALRAVPDSPSERVAQLRARQRFIESTRDKPAARQAWAWGLAGVLCLGIALVSGFAVKGLSVVPHGLARSEAGELRPLGPAGGELRFSDGSQVRLPAGSALRIDDLGMRGARLRLTEGRALVDVVHRPFASWTIAAGPLSIEVTGTSFEVAWSAQRLDLHMRDGSVIVSGPSLPEGVRVTAGERLSVDLAHHAVAKSSAMPQAKAPAARASLPILTDPPASGAAAAASVPLTPSSSSHAPWPQPTWSQLVAAGDFAGVVRDAESKGIEAALVQGSVADVAALGDAARYLGRARLAEQSFQALRRRFPRTERSATAGFNLGRLSEDSLGDGPGAIRWYEQYLSEAPAGTFAAEARSRKMLALARAGRRAEARTAALDYLRRHPEGAQAARAREIAGAR